MKKISKTVSATAEQLKFLEDLWFVWGNNGSRHSMDNHKFIQNILERNQFDSKFFHPDSALVSVVEAILNSEIKRAEFGKCEKCGKKTFNQVVASGRWSFWCGCV